MTICCGDIRYRKQAASLVLLQEQTGLLVLAFREFSKISLKICWIFREDVIIMSDVMLSHLHHMILGRPASGIK